MKPKIAQNDCSPSFDLNKRVSECDDMMTQYWNENPDLFEAVKEKKETAKIISTLWKGFPNQLAPLLFPKIAAALPKEAKPSLTELMCQPFSGHDIMRLYEPFHTPLVTGSH